MSEENMSFGWDDEIEESDFELVPDGDYQFTVTDFERAWWEPYNPDTSKIQACNQANIELTIDWMNGNGQMRSSKIQHRLKLTRSLQFLIYQFFECVGLRKKGDGTTKMPWDQIVGKTGICQVGHHEDTKGNTYNDIIKCYTPENAPTVTNNGAASEPQFKL